MTTVQQLLDGKGRAIYSIGPEDPVLQAIKHMAERHVGALVVMKGQELARDRLRARLRAEGHPDGPLLRRHAR